MNQAEALTRFIRDLNSLHVPYMITGAYAVSYFGLPRATHDLDIVIAIRPIDVDNICRKFGKGYIVDRAMVENAVLFGTHFSIIHTKNDLKIDFWILKEKTVERDKFERRNKISIFGVSTFVISSEDIILTKLEWFKHSKNTKHLDDAIGIIKVQDNNLDKHYITSLLGKYDIKKYWKMAVDKAKS